MKELIEQLKEPVPYKWRVSRINKVRRIAECVPYIDARQVMDRLDEVVGPGNWQDEYTEIGGNIYCTIKILNKDTGEWISRSDCGKKSNQEPEKGEASDAFKRAAVKWGLGRFLYQIDTKYVSVTERQGKFIPVHPDTGKQLSGEDLSNILNKSQNGKYSAVARR